MRLLAVVLALCCVLPVPEAIAQWDHPIIRTWEWVRTEYASGEVVTPETASYTLQREFGTLGQADNYRLYRNERLREVAAYGISHVWVDDCCIEFVCIWGATREECWDLGFSVQGELQLLDYALEPTVVETYAPRGPVAAGTVTWGRVKSLFR